MSSETTAQSDTELIEDVRSFLRMNFPQIAIHGGETAVPKVDAETGEVWIKLSGACGGCGISRMTTSAIQQSLVQQHDAVSIVHVETV